MFALKGLKEFRDLNGARFRELPRALQNALKVRPYLRVITLLKQSHPRLKYEVFIRLNRGGIRLNNQEIRNVAFRGALNDAIYEASEDELLKLALKINGPKSVAFQQMQDAEYVLRFLTLNQSWKNFSGSLSQSMDEFMLDNRNSEETAILLLVKPFREAIYRTSQLWGEVAFQRWDGQRWRQQALAGLYDAEMIACSLLSSQQVASASEKQKKIINATKILFENNEFEEAVRLGTNTPARIKFRIEQVYDMLVNFA